MYNQNIYLNLNFLSLIQGLESFHRVMIGGKYLSDEDYKTCKDTLISAIPVDIGNDHKNSLKSRINFGNEYSLRKRIKDILSSLSRDTIILISPTDSYFMNEIIDTRNYLTHHDHEMQNQALSGIDLYYANLRLRILLCILLLRGIGIEEKIIVNSLCRNREFKEIFAINRQSRTR